MVDKAMRTSRRGVLKGGSAIAGSAALGSLAGCLGSITGGGSASVTVGSKQFTEQELLGSMSVQALEANVDASINDKTSLGGTTTNFEALKAGDIDHYWEYTGTAWATLPPKHSEVITEPQEIYDKVKSEFDEEYNIKLLDRAPFNNTYVLMARPKWAEKTGITTLSGLAKYVNNGNTDFTVVMDAEFAEREDGWPGLIEHYGFADGAGNLEIKNVGPALGYQILGKGEADVGMGFNTNPKIVKWDLVVLDDDKKFFPVYNPAPMVKGETLDVVSGMEGPLNSIATSLDTETIRGLNKRVSIDGEKAADVAGAFLSEIGVV